MVTRMEKQASIFSIGILSSNHHTYGSCQIVILGTCKQEKAEPHALLIKNVIKACEDKSITIGPPLFCVASDGESHRGSALIILTHRRLLLPTSPIYPLLSNL